MFFKKSLCAIAVAVCFVSTGYAQEISASHIAEAKKALTATKATETFDSILLGASAKLKNQLTANNPSDAEKIGNTVDDEAIALAVRRGDLEGEAARLFAKNFTESELTEITTFFTSPTGAKYLVATPLLARELGKAARIWANGITRDLAVNVNKKMAASGN